MFKANTEIIVIEAKTTKPITTGVVFWSYDHGTAKMIFKLLKDNVPQSLAEGTIVPICLVFNGGRHIYHAEIVDALNGIVSIVLEDNILGYIGRVDGSIYIELPDSRSLDTAGRFTFDIKRSPIDENVPELEDYYWQGFSEIMTQYHQTIATIKLEAKELLDSLSVDVTKVKNDIVTANTRIAEINQKIDDNDVFTKQESSANVVDQVIGNETSTRNITTDMKNKVATSVIENPNLAFTSYGATELLTPENGFETPQSSYDELSAVDTRIFTLTRSEANKPSQLLISWDILTIAKKNLGEKFFFDNGAMDKASQIELLRKRLLTLSGNCIGFGSGPGGYKLNLSSWRRTDGTWQYRTPHTNATDTKISNTIGTASILAYIDEDGFYHNIIYAESCDGVTPSTIKVNYVSVEFTLSISANNHIESMIADNHVQNLATQAEAEAGTDTTKTMTPATTAQSIDNRAVTLASNQTIGGIKNFKDGLLLDSKTVITQQNADATYAVKSIGMSLWTGISTLNENHTVTPTKKLSECQNGWLLVFAPYNGSTAQNYDVTTVFVPKGHTRLSIAQIFNGSNWTQKRYQCSDSTITGHSSNVGTEQIKAALIEVREV